MNYSTEFLTQIYKTLYRIRVFETTCVQLYRQGLIRGYFHPYLGEEAIATGVCAALGENDYITSTHRGHGHCIARGATLDKMVAELFGKSTGYCKGLGGSMHIADPDTGNLGANGIVGGGIPIGVGAALSLKLQKKDGVAVVFFSDGGSNNGVFAESLNLAAIWNLPVIFLLENNQYAVSTPIEDSSRTELFERGKGYGVESIQIDGNDILKVHEETLKAIEKCKAGKGPILVEAKTFRHGGHHVNDPGLYMPKEKLDHYKAKDPVLIVRDYLSKKSNEDNILQIERDIDQEMENAIEFAKNSPELSSDDFMKMVEAY